MSGTDFVSISTYDELQRTVAGAVLADAPIFIWGAPGVGKTHVVERIAHDMGYEFFRLSAICRQPEEFTGYPRAEGDTVKLLLPEWVGEGDRPTVVLLDDLADANEYVQASAYALADQRMVGVKKLPLRIVAAANPPDDNVFGSLPPAGIRARFLHVLFKPTVHSWAEQIHTFESNREVADTLAVLAGYLARSYSPLSVKGSVGIACPRTWHACARAIVAGVDVRVALASVLPEAEVIAQYVGYDFEILKKETPNRREILWFASLIRNSEWVREPPQWWASVPEIVEFSQSDLPKIGESGK